MSEYDALRKIINHEANQDDDAGFFAQLGGIQPEHDDEGPTARGLFQHMNFNRNSYTYLYDPKIMPKKTWLDHMINAFKAPFNQKPKREPITRVRRVWRGPNPITGRTFSTWYWQCALCDHNQQPRETGSTHYGELCFTWAEANRRATHHARNHHRSQK